MKKYGIFLLSLILVLAMFPTSVLASSDDAKFEVNTVKELKNEIHKFVENDGEVSAKERESLNEQANPEVLNDFVEQKTEDAMKVLESAEIVMDFDEEISLLKKIDIGDDCWVKIELDEGEDIDFFGYMKSMIFEPIYGATHVSTMWKGYGNRYFTAKYTAQYGVAYVSYKLENHYKLGTNGIVERYGTPSASDSGIASVSVIGSSITDKTAPKIGHNVNLHATYKTKYGYDPIQWSRTYKLDTIVKYLAIDKAGKEVKISHSFAFSRL